MNTRFLTALALAALAWLASACPEPVIIDDPVQGPISARTQVTLHLEVQEAELEEVLANLQTCTPRTFGPFSERPGDSSSATFSITCHVTEIRQNGIDFNCTTQPNGSSCSLSALFDERVESTCRTPGGSPIWFHIGP